MNKLIRGGARYDTPENWKIANPVLKPFEPGGEIGTGLFKYGDGVTAWNDLPYANINASGVAANEGIIMEVTGDGYYVRHKDPGARFGGWVELPVQEAPADGKLYCRNGKTNSWDTINLDNKIDNVFVKSKENVTNNFSGNSFYLQDNNVTEETFINFTSDSLKLQLVYAQDLSVKLYSINNNAEIKPALVATLSNGNEWFEYDETIEQTRIQLTPQKELKFNDTFTVTLDENIEDCNLVQVYIEKPIDLKNLVERVITLENKLADLENK